MAKSEQKQQVEREAWRNTVAMRAEKDGFFEEIGPLHKAIHITEDGARVVFYGTSMGGYAAAAFSAASPGATVVAIGPQATMDRMLAGWDHRYKRSWKQDYDGPYGYAPAMSAEADKHRLLIRFCFDVLKTRPAPHFKQAAQRARQHLRENA